jgi:hypothetical protein
VSASGTSAFTSEVLCQAAGIPTREAPVLSSPSNSSTVTTNTVTLFWNRVPWTNSYEVQWGTSTNFERTLLVQSDRWTTESAIGGGLTYYWRVRAVGSVPGDFSPWSPTWSFATPNPLAVGNCFLRHDFGDYISGTVANASDRLVTSATITFVALDGSGKRTTVWYIFHDVAGGQVVNFFINVPSGTVSVVLMSLTIP